ncbi:DUF5126 domain-containing protein [Membranicola marinus]|uniref:DUF5126 domain-containing protein n=1 Tax=Membranihabitans marinus TaxID=1227546 RepID=A0A953HK45_9BACT|nr:DUF5000 domain-containing lipoprotein [Membranihabitans marinus]MBY5957354.1 DUF5126 domain-containing protein [Membranihabitans marinus]
MKFTYSSKQVLIPLNTDFGLWGFILFFALSMTLISCGKENLNVPLDNDSVAPSPVTNIQWEAIPGGAVITYTIPTDSDLLYVLGEYEIRPGVPQEQKTSFYERQMTLRGFGDTKEHEVKLYAVDRSGNKSEPVSVRITPLTSPVQQAFESLDYYSDFGGITVSLLNESQDNLVISILTKDSLGDWEDYDNFYSGLPEIDFSIRGLPAEPVVFGVYIKDRWQNVSDTLEKELTPLFEEELDKTRFRELRLPGDGANTWDLSALWDNVTTRYNGFRTADNEGLPTHFNIDLGVKAKLSRFRTWQVHDGREYSASNARLFELWGSNEPSPDGSYEGWTKLGEYEVKKPSGLPVGEISNEDIASAAAGDEHTVPISAPAIRYVRIKIIATFIAPPNASTGGAWMVETGFWGNEVE